MGTKGGAWLCRWMVSITVGLIGLAESNASPPFPHITDEKFIEDCLKSHNLNRSKVSPTASNMRYMTWDAALAITARSWSKFCIFDHNIYLKDVKKVHPSFPSVGENIWTGYPPSIFSVEKAMQSWVDDELKHYRYDDNTCQRNKVCGHYTQVVWASSYKVGCAVHLCPNGVKHFAEGKASALFVCNYSPAGNSWREKPYQAGRSCSGCGGGETCEKSLCRDPTRDKTISYFNWNPEWDPDRARCGAFCAAVLILRPLLLLATFGSVVAIKTQYPNMFAYE